MRMGLQPSSKPDTATGEFVNEAELLNTVLPICRRTLKKRREEGLIPYVQIGRRIVYHVPSVREALLRQQRGLEA